MRHPGDVVTKGADHGRRVGPRLRGQPNIVEVYIGYLRTQDRRTVRTSDPADGSRPGLPARPRSQAEATSPACQAGEHAPARVGWPSPNRATLVGPRLSGGGAGGSRSERGLRTSDTQFRLRSVSALRDHTDRHDTCSHHRCDGSAGNPRPRRGRGRFSRAAAQAFGGLLLLIALVFLGLVLLRRYGLIPDTLTLGRRPSPEDGARRLLAERMATGEVSTEEFMERASVLNWTPGSDVNPPVTRFRRRR